MSATNYSTEVQINLKMGLHIRPSSELSKVANQYPCLSRIIFNNRRADCKSPMELMGLGAEQGSRMLLETSGEQAEEALNVMAALFADNFGINEDDEE